MKKGRRREELEQILSTSEKEIAGYKEKLSAAHDRWVEEASKGAEVISLRMQNQKLQKQIQLVQHIAAGRTAQAIEELLDPMAVVFNMDVRIVGDSAVEKAKEETLASVVKIVTDHLSQLRVKPVKKEDADESSES